jgi:MSHA pilin protein MshA
MKSNKQQGFTLIELIIVIVILGILAVTASPKFLDLSGDARESTLSGLSGSIKGAANIVYSKALIDGTAGNATGSSVTVNGTAVELNHGYPTADAAGIQLALDLDSADWSLGDVDTDFADGGTDADTAGTFSIRPVDGGSATCQILYTSAQQAADGSGGAVTPPAVTVTVSGC